ncbi:hypothetical protein GCM10029992_28040 [Glycomyces albus]
MTSAEERRTFGRVVRSLRERAGRGRPEFAAACHTSESHLRNIENGHKSAGASLMCDLEQQLGTHGLLSDLATCGENGVRRRTILQSLALMGATIPDTDVDTGRVGTPQLEILRSMTATLRSLDNRHGGTHATHSIVAYLQQVAVPMLSGPVASTVREPLLSSVAELMLLAGWSAFDSGVQGSARAYFSGALELAEEAGNASSRRRRPSPPRIRPPSSVTDPTLWSPVKLRSTRPNARAITLSWVRHGWPLPTGTRSSVTLKRSLD